MATTEKVEILRETFYKNFIKSAEKEFNLLTLQDFNSRLKSSENIIRAFCSGLSLVTVNPLIGKVTASAVKILIKKVEEGRRQERLETAQDVIGQDYETKEFRAAFHKLMLRSAIEIWFTFENQFLSIQTDSRSTGRFNRQNSLFRSLRRRPSSKLKRRESNNNFKSLNERQVKIKQAEKTAIQKLAAYAAIHCINYLIEEKKIDYPHKFILAPDFWDRAKAKWRQWFSFESIPLVWSDNFFDKSTVEFFKDPIPIQNTAPQSANSWLVTPRMKKSLKKCESSKNKKENILKFRRNFDFEQENSQEFVSVCLEQSLIEELDPNYFNWSDKSCDIDSIYEKLLEDPNFNGKEDEKNLSAILQKLSEVSAGMIEFKKDLTQLKLNVDKIITQQQEVRRTVLDIQLGQLELTQNVIDLKDTNLEVKVQVEEIRLDQIELKEKVKEIHDQIIHKNRRTSMTPRSSLAPPVSTFSMTEKPPNWFTGREEIIENIHSIIKSIDQENDKDTADLEVNILNRMVLISGLGGIGKSSTCKKFAQEFMKTHKKNVAWLNAETEESLKDSFFNLAANFKISSSILSKQQPASGGGATRNDVIQLVGQIYRHFSNHVKEGILIFDNANQMRSTQQDFGLQNFLPCESLPFYPIFLITSRNKNWPTVPHKIHLSPLSRLDTLSFFCNSLKIPSNIPETFQKCIQNLGDLLDGYPLALNLAAASILENLQLLGFHFDSSSTSQDEGQRSSLFPVVCSEIENYISEFHTNGLKWVTYEGEGVTMSHYDKIMATVWEGTINKLTRVIDPLHKLATDLLHLIAYLPTDLISVEFCHFIHNQIKIQQEIFSHQIEQSQRGLVRKAFGILEKYSMVQILPQEMSIHFPYYQTYSGLSVRVHRLVQKWTRESLKKVGQSSDILKLCEYLQTNGLRFEYWDCAREYLKELKWPLKSYGNSFFIHYFGVHPEGKRFWREIQIYLNEFHVQDEEFSKICQLALKFYERSRSRDSILIEGEEENLLDLTLELTLKYPKNQLLYHLATPIFFNVDYETLVTEKRRPKLFEWIRAHFDFLQHESQIFSPTLNPTIPIVSFHKELKGQWPLTFVNLSVKLLPPKEFIAKVALAVEFRLKNDGHLHCLTFLSSALVRLRSWPLDIWRMSSQETELSPVENEEIARQLLTTFLDNRALSLLTLALTRFKEIFEIGHFIEMRHIVVFGLIQNLAYFDEIAKRLLNSKEFIGALTLVFQAVAQQRETTVNDRRAHIGIVFSWFALLSNKNRLVTSSTGINYKSVEESMTNFIEKLDTEKGQELELSDPDEFEDHCCPIYYNEIRRGRFSRSRRGIVHTFISSHDKDDQNENSNILIKCAIKLLQVLNTRCSCTSP